MVWQTTERKKTLKLKTRKKGPSANGFLSPTYWVHSSGPTIKVSLTLPRWMHLAFCHWGMVAVIEMWKKVKNLCGHRQPCVRLTCLRRAAGERLVPPEAHGWPLPVLKSTQPLGKTSAARMERRRSGGWYRHDRQAGRFETKVTLNRLVSRKNLKDFFWVRFSRRDKASRQRFSDSRQGLHALTDRFGGLGNSNDISHPHLDTRCAFHQHCSMRKHFWSSVSVSWQQKASPFPHCEWLLMHGSPDLMRFKIQVHWFNLMAK